jgi:hypothetical protein
MSEVVDAEVIDQRTGEVLPAPYHAASSMIVSADPTAVVEAFAKYKEIQSALDRAMPDCIQNIRGKMFRKKMYWRAIATAFNLSLELVKEDRTEDGEDWGWLVTYRATAPNGRHADGDGSCFASEKSSGQDSVHNVRAHAHTRAKNRAVADLVGFGEVSAEEMPHDDYTAAPPKREPVKRGPKPAPPPRDESNADPAAQGLMYKQGAPQPSIPKFAGWVHDKVTKNDKSDFKDADWEHMMQGSFNGLRYKWCRRVLSMDNPPASTAERARIVVWHIEQKEYHRLADAEIAKEAAGEESPF